MAGKTINPTRMELTRLKAKQKTALRGHKLLKDKRDGLMKQFMQEVRRTRQLRKRVEEGLAQANAAFTVANVARRRTNQPRDGVFLLEFGHIDGGQVLATAVEQLCQLQDGFGFTHTAGASQQERTERASRKTQVGACGQ